MTTIAEMARRFKSFDIMDVVREALVDNEENAISINQNQLYEKGENKEEETLLQYRSLFYALKKNEINPMPGLFNPDLNLTGAFFRGFYAKVNRDEIVFGSNDKKSGSLMEKYGSNIFGLSYPSKEEFSRFFLNPSIFQIIARYTGIRSNKS